MVQVEKQTNHLLVVYYFSYDVAAYSSIAAYISRPLILIPADPFWNPVFVLLRLVKTITFRNGFVTPDPHWVASRWPETTVVHYACKFPVVGK